MRRLIVFFGALAAIILIVTAIGYMLPVEHTAVVKRTLDHPVPAVWAKITNVKNYPEWRRSVDDVEVISGPNGPFAWREKTGRDTMTFRVTERAEERRLVVVIADENLPFGGSWTYGLSPAGDGCTLTITEDGEVYNPIFRFVGRFFLDPTKTMNTFLNDLERGLSSNT